MTSLNEKRCLIRFTDFMDGPDGWGRAFGGDAHRKFVDYVESHPGQNIFRVSMKDVGKIDFSYASEAIVEVIRRFRGVKSICLVDLEDKDIIDNIDAAASQVKVPIMIWNGGEPKLIGQQPSQGNKQAFAYALAHTDVRAAEFAEAVPNISIANASTKFKQLWEQGFLMRSEGSAESGGVEFIYHRIG